MHFATFPSESVPFLFLGGKISNWQLILSAPEVFYLWLTLLGHTAFCLMSPPRDAAHL